MTTNKQMTLRPTTYRVAKSAAKDYTMSKQKRDLSTLSFEHA